MPGLGDLTFPAVAVRLASERPLELLGEKYLAYTNYK
jgi:hypothetical protein